MLHDNTWTPGFLLLVIAALESLAIHARISGAYDEDEEGLSIPHLGALPLLRREYVYSAEAVRRCIKT